LQFTEAKMGRIFVVRLHDGDHLPDVLENFAEKQKVNCALCFFLGGANENSCVVVGPKNGNVFPPEPMVTLLKGVHEACGVGTIFVNEEGKPKLHMHAAFGRNEETITGCVRMGVDVWQIGEVVILELGNAAVQRNKNKKTGFEFLEIKD
jgi:predicted DNA-binding protein with PD1-like motif